MLNFSLFLDFRVSFYIGSTIWYTSNFQHKKLRTKLTEFFCISVPDYMDCGLWTVDCGLWTVDCGLWTVDYGLWTVDCPASRNPQPTTHRLKIFVSSSKLLEEQQQLVTFELLNSIFRVEIVLDARKVDVLNCCNGFSCSPNTWRSASTEYLQYDILSILRTPCC